MEPSGRSPVARPFAGFRQQPHRSFGADSVKADIRPTNKTARRRSGHAAFWDWRRATTLALVFRSPPCVCGRDLIEVTHGIAVAASEGLLRLSES
jgi:hypothetical protein